MKTSQILDLQSKLDASEKRNFSLEAQIKEFKLKLEFSESDPRKWGG
jgi:peptidoglycan hydrolase CwlO-like protein